MNSIVFSLPPSIVVQLVLAVVLPLFVGLITKRVTSSGARAVLLAAVTLVTSLLTQLGVSLADGTPYDLGLGLLAAIPAFAISVATHFGLWKPTGASDGVIAVGSKPTDDPGVGDDPADPAAIPAILIPETGGLVPEDDDGEDRDANEASEVDPYPEDDPQDDDTVA